MLEINDKPLHGEIRSGTILRKGEIAQLFVENGTVVIGKSDGACPIGMVMTVWKFGRILDKPDAPSVDVEHRRFLVKLICMKRTVSIQSMQPFIAPKMVS